MKPTRSNPAATAKPAGPSPRSAGPLPPDRTPFGPLVALLLTILGTTAIRLRLLSMPLERDEGEYAYAGQLILQGHPPYERLYNMKWPGTYYCYALFEAVFGQTIAGVRLGVLFVNLAAVVLVFLIGRRLLDASAAVAAAVAYAILSLSPATIGFAGHATHFVVLFALAGILCLQRAREQQRLSLYFLAGLFAGLAPIMKQPGIVFTAFVLAFWVWQEVRDAGRDWIQTPSFGVMLLTGRLASFFVALTSLWPTRSEWRQARLRGAVLLAGILAPFSALLASLWATRTFSAFCLWTISYARHYGEPLTTKTFSYFLECLLAIPGDGVVVWILAGRGLLALPLHPRTRAAAPFLLGLLIFSFVGVLFGLTFREHYFILMLPAVAFLVGATVFVVRQRLLPRFPRFATACTVALVLIPLSTAFAMEGPFYLWMTPEQACRHVYQQNPFIEAVAVADYIRAHSNPDDRIAIIGSEPEIYFYCRRPSATGFIYMYSLMEKQPFARQFRQQMIQEIEAAQPKYVVFVNLKASWLPPPNADMTIANWFIDYQSRHLKLVGIVEADDAMRITYRWDKLELPPQENVRNVMTVYERVSPP